MKKEQIKTQTLKELAEDWGINYQVLKIKQSLVGLIKKYCEENCLSQRRLASIVPGLTQDRVSKIFSGQIGHMSIDKLVQILSVLDIELNIQTKKAA
jgi:predicted XRE-type DNA-binding protein